MQKNVYIVLTQTGTVLSRIIKAITGAEYNHSSISLTDTLTPMYSFGRRNPYNPFWGGYIKEQPKCGIFKRLPDTTSKVISIKVSEETYEELKVLFESMYDEKEKYGYNFIGLCLAAFGIVLRRERHLYCSEFIRDVFRKYKIEGYDLLDEIIQPVHFMRMPHEVVYCGRINDYPESSSDDER
ncbi:MAG: hypothetical protein E7665_03225 [Ruminococcaceae bacterium]|nr:hypothetical protein [Oscillospiraceae bacterium]